MNYTVSVDFPTLATLEPEKARTVLAKLIAEHDGRPTRIAEAAEISHTALKRWIDKLGLRETIEEVRAERGLPPARTAARAARGQLEVADPE